MWVTMRDRAVAEVEDFLGPQLTDGQARLVESAGGNSILLAIEDELEPLAAFFHDRYHRCGGFATHTSLEDAEDAITADLEGAGDLVVPVELDASETQAVERMIQEVDAGSILATIMGLSSFTTRYYQSTSGVDAASWLRDQWADLAAGRDDVTVELFEHPSWAQPSVIMTIEGQDTPDEVVVIGGHLDSISFGGGTAPGADDDASGVATLTEAARILLADQDRLQKTVKFMAYAAEEVGLRGSDEIAEEFAAEQVQVVGVMQLDMTNYNGSAGTDIVLLTDFTNPALTDFLDSLAGTYLPELNTARDACGYACSDHASWHRAGFPTVMPFESLLDDYNPTIHTSQDTLSVSDNNANHATKFAKLALAWIVETAKVSGSDPPPPPPPPPPPAGTLLVQVAYDIPGADLLGEFAEVRNDSDQAIDLTGWTLRDRSSSWAFPDGTTVPAGGTLSIASDTAGFTARYGKAPGVGGMTLALGNARDELTLVDPTGTEVDQVQWETPPDWPIAANTGQSVVRTGAEDTDTVADWSVAPAQPH